MGKFDSTADSPEVHVCDPSRVVHRRLAATNRKSLLLRRDCVCRDSGRNRPPILGLHSGQNTILARV